MKALYGYFGNITEHNLDIPGHPLYQLNLLDSLKNTFKVDEFTIAYYYDYKQPEAVQVLPEVRQELFNSLNLRFGNEQYLSEFDLILLKHRFRNASRLRDTNLTDVAAYERCLRIAHELKIPVYVIDTDASITESFYRRFSDIKILSYFNESIYPRNISYTKISPTSEILFKFANVVQTSTKQDCFVYDGNNYFKDLRLINLLNTAVADPFFKEILIHGKGWPIKAFPRTERVQFYKEVLEKGKVTVNLTKPLYEKNCFVSPRIIEALMLGVIPIVPEGYICLPEEVRFASIDEAFQKMLYFSENYSKELVLDCVKYLLNWLEANDYKGV